MTPFSEGRLQFATAAEADLGGGQSALVQLRAYLAQGKFPPATRLPPERELAEVLGVSRGDLRKALAVLEDQGELWRHVGKGTFIGARPTGDLSSVANIANQTSPAEVMHARLVIEPELAREAALHATADDVRALRHCASSARMAETWRQYENWDNRLHRAIAQASRNALLLAVFDTINAVRRTVVWGRLRDDLPRPPADHHSFADHDAIVDAIEERNLSGAANGMRLHLQRVQARLLSRRDIAE
ncbi:MULTISPECIES: FCD domain-containing protein [unclassified Sinorhizobium]|uniref:FadR/GntR family transcriptional regulator n=1 Tax=unclassified Sinorhizobium TaxID=2613772 RepID=UPI0024C35D95|nr:MULTISPECIES: FCD domain-containing protein [unclassified Sinorhizobium]MDK1374508.1 FCD domain-containing protein [Sinorhizobium sp. 6-70]MDK1479162.1 FCD domain-containing protein [Sinorhizobium sp. 6-117]